MKSLLVLCLLTLAVSGCTVDGYEIKQSQELCSNHDGVDYMYTSNGFVRCNDGTSFNIRSRGG